MTAARQVGGGGRTRWSAADNHRIEGFKRGCHRHPPVAPGAGSGPSEETRPLAWAPRLST